jgi:hypothetical protein
MPYIAYDKNREGVIVGRFTKKETANKYHLPHIEITVLEFEQVSKDINNYQVIGNKLVALERNFTNFTKVKSVNHSRRNTAIKISEPILVNGFLYTPDSAFQQNLSICLSISSIDKDHTAFLWCLFDKVWEFRQHSVYELLEIAKALNSRRESKSQELYKNL